MLYSQKGTLIIDYVYSLTLLILSSSNVFVYYTGVRELRFLHYLGFLVGLLFCYIYGIKSFKKIPSATKAYLLLIIYSLITCFSFTIDGIGHLVFWLAAVLMVLPNHDFKLNIRSFNLIYVIVQMSIVRELHIDLSIASFLESSTSSVETNAPAFLLPIFFVYFLYAGDKVMCLINLFVSVIFGKRIIMIVLIYVLIVYCYQKYLTKRKSVNNSSFTPIMVNAVYLIIIVLFVSGVFSEFLMSLFGVDIGILTMGRNMLYEVVVTDLLKSDFIQWLFGHGTASVQIILQKQFNDILHNDVLKILYEYGCVVFVVFFWLLYRDVKSWSQFSLISAINVFFLTDNTLIYTSVITMFLLVDQKLKNNNKNEKKLRFVRRWYAWSWYYIPYVTSRMRNQKTIL